MLIYMIRHGQTDWNAEGRLQGQKDIPLNALGRSQAVRNGERLREMIGAAEGFAFVASPLSRTRETMELLRAAMGLDPEAYQIDERLRELSFGDWEGHTLKEISRMSPDRKRARTREKWSFIPPGTTAESYEILCWRIGAWLQSVDGPTVCISHGGVIRSLFRLVGNLAEDDAATAPTPQDRILRIDTDHSRMEWF
ncbi:MULTISPECIES: histidine phosphatase family protein [Rhizobium/Agrobacterium group]|uniref:Phosphoglycerate mutase family protein n=1 Tax=Neorhizobium petrolearium TaxID=515361 RepID=A0ABY8M3B1_9HYPH|nr:MULTISPECIES: histidine phosphatase family protein [Rhizobium/Agrobacterium group]KGD86037.1 phosphoglycerate mutase [Rhizobium sp. YS-1r]MCC2608789.1 phosphoglycerate mutase family protein [Neorhizobium petrolearium]WGI69043.1 phosphoglycerate mutase family protein [Neorhizobium petrolearium]